MSGMAGMGPSSPLDDQTQNTVSLGRYILREATFWVPNIERNLFGLTLLTTDGRLQIGAIADRTGKELLCT